MQASGSSLNRFFVSDYFRAWASNEAYGVLRPVSIASSSAITSGRRLGSRRGSRLGSLNRFFVSDYFRAAPPPTR